MSTLSPQILFHTNKKTLFLDLLQGLQFGVPPQVEWGDGVQSAKHITHMMGEGGE
jgi:hypothetical protein